MQKNRLSWMIGGPQGSGINASAEVFAKACSRAGLRVFANIEYHSNIIVTHSFYRVRVYEDPIHSYRDKADILVALDHETLAGDGDHRRWPTHYGHIDDLSDGAGVIYDSAIEFDPATVGRADLKFFAVPFMDIIKAALEEIGKGEQARRYEVMKNTVGLGASLARCDYPFDLVADVIMGQFKGKRTEIGTLNVRAPQLAIEYVKKHVTADFSYKLQPHRKPEARLLAKGYEIHAIAKLKAGCHFQTYYPISPATDESVYLEKNQREFNLLVVQCEDEISSINMAVGAAHMGVRSATATSGPGFALMVEGIGFASITEAPGPVLVMYQRGGPSTGLPTRQEQGDLQFVLHPAQGDFPHVVIAPGDLSDAFQDTFSAFNWAERYQMPVDDRRARPRRTHHRRRRDAHGDDGQAHGQARPPAEGDPGRAAVQAVGSGGRGAHRRGLGLDEGDDPRRDRGARRAGEDRQLPAGPTDEAVPGRGRDRGAGPGEAARARRGELLRAAGLPYPRADRREDRAADPEIRRPALERGRARAGAVHGSRGGNRGAGGDACPLRPSPSRR